MRRAVEMLRTVSTSSSLFLLIVLMLAGACAKKERRVLVFSKTAGYRHASIGAGKLALIKLGTSNEIAVDTTEDATAFTEDNLKKYSAVIFLSTTQNVLDPLQQADFKRYIEAGGGFVGIHAAADTEYEWPWYGKLLGAYFKSHPEQQEAKLKKVKPFGPNTLPDTWIRKDEWYNYKKISPDINVIYTIDESSYKGGENGADHPIAWYHEFEGGRVFYTGLGHTDESYSEPLFLEHVLQGIQYAIGDNDELNYKAVKTKRAVEENRFSKVVLDFNLNEPTEMTILPDGKIIFIERKGGVKLYTPSTNKVTQVNTIPAWTKEEDGLIGLTSDPDFQKNHFVYVFYSHPDTVKPANVLSRFVFTNDSLDLKSEKRILEVPTQRKNCCHTGGSLQFAKDRVLFISTGDNVSPFESDSYSPSDERPGRSTFDAQGSSANTNDLRGKILRIIVNEDATYSIPEGNLFPKGEPKTRPEIYVMGDRNPYRISVDSKTGYLYWGEVGPDAGKDDSIRGPRGYDELNQAKKAGFFGWPYFVGNNYAYARHNFETKVTGERHDPTRPINPSPNNTGKRELPPAQPALIWYPYDKSDDFPMVKDGGRNAMAGPVYYSDQFQGTKEAFPDYLDGKVLIYDWMRNWMFLMTLDETQGIMDLEPFMQNSKFNNIIDMAYGPDGKLYMIEYGTAWFKQNLDARLVRIDYNGGNRAPAIKLAADTQSGAVPLKVNFTSAGSLDYDGSKLKYEAQIGDQMVIPEGESFTYTFEKPGIYNVKLTGTDPEGLSSSATVKVIAGNAAPDISVKIIGGNSEFFFPGTPVKYEVIVTDKEDGSTESKSIPADKIKVTFKYLQSIGMTDLPKGHQMRMPDHPGKVLMEGSDCKSCHLMDQKSAGPGFMEIAATYKGKAGVTDQLAEKIIRGGSGVWGNIEMSAHPQISVDDAKKIVEYLLSLGETEKTYPLIGSIRPGNEKDGAYFLNASYTDKGAPGNIPALSTSSAIALKAPVLKPEKASAYNGPRVLNYNGQRSLENVTHNSSVTFSQVDLTGITGITAQGYVMPGQQVGGELVVHLDKIDGPVWAQVKLTGQGILAPSVKIKPVAGLHDLYLVFTNPDAGNKQLFYFGGLQFSNK